MKKHLSNIILIISIVIFCLTMVDFYTRFCVAENYHNYYNISTAKALVKIYKESISTDTVIQNRYLKKVEDAKGVPFEMKLDSELLKLAYKDEGLHYSTKKKFPKDTIIKNMGTSSLAKVAFVEVRVGLFNVLSRYIITFLCVLASIVFIGSIKKYKANKQSNDKDNEKSMRGLYFATCSVLIWAVSGYLRLLYWDNQYLIFIFTIIGSTINNLCVAFLIPNIILEEPCKVKSIQKKYFQSDNYKWGVVALAMVCGLVSWRDKNIADYLDLSFSVIVDLCLLIYLGFAFYERKMPLFIGFSAITILLIILNQFMAIDWIFERISFLLNNYTLLLYLRTLIGILYVFGLIMILFALIVSFEQHKAEKRAEAEAAKVKAEAAKAEAEAAKAEAEAAKSLAATDAAKKAQKSEEEALKQKEYADYLKADIEHRIKGLFNALVLPLSRKTNNPEAQIIFKELDNELTIRRKIHEVITGDAKENNRDLPKTFKDLLVLHKVFDIELTENVAIAGLGLETVHYQIVQSLVVLVNELLNNARKYGGKHITIDIKSIIADKHEVLTEDFSFEIGQKYLYIKVSNVCKKSDTESSPTSMGHKINTRVVTGLNGAIRIPESMTQGEIYVIEIYIPISQLLKKQ